MKLRMSCRQDHDRALGQLELPRHEMSSKIKEKILQVGIVQRPEEGVSRCANPDNHVSCESAAIHAGKSDLTAELEERFGIGWGN